MSEITVPLRVDVSAEVLDEMQRMAARIDSLEHDVASLVTRLYPGVQFATALQYFRNPPVRSASSRLDVPASIRLDSH